MVLEELAEAAVDTDWLARAVALIDQEPADAAEAACRLRVLRRAEHALAAARITATADLADRCEREGTGFADLEVAVALGVGLAKCHGALVVVVRSVKIVVDAG